MTGKEENGSAIGRVLDVLTIAGGPDRKGEYQAFCPAHDDKKTPNLRIREADDGRVLLRCFAGCGQDKVLSALTEKGIGKSELFTRNGRGGGRESTTTRDHVHACTLEAYAETKKLPVEFLARLGLSNTSYVGKPAVRILYLKEDGTESAVRFRIALEKGPKGDERFRWRKGSKPSLYGLWRLEHARDEGYVFLVEGESDAQTLWHHGLAAQRVRLREIRAICDQQNLEIDHYTEVEKDISKEIGSLDIEFSDVRQTLASLGVELDGRGDIRLPHRPLTPLRLESHSEKTPPSIDFEDLVAEAGLYLTETGVDPNKDPLLQLLGQSEASDINRRYRRAFGEVTWDQSDYLAILLAGFIATLLDVFLVRIPLDGAFLGRMQAGSPMSRWIRQNSKSVHDHYLGDLERAAKVPYDLTAGKALDGLSPKVHRLMSLGHDPILAFIVGTIDIMSGTGTYIDKHGDLRRIATSMSPESLVSAFLKVFLHLLSDVFTSAGVQPPFFTLLQLAKTKSPFVLGPSGEKVSWTNVARYMYTHGYDLRHFATMGIVPASVEMIVRGWWLCRSFESNGEIAPTKAKLTSMMMLAHLTATSGTLLKTGVIFGMNPLALNWAQLLALPPVTLAWITETLKRNRSIRNKLDEEWISTYQAMPGSLV